MRLLLVLPLLFACVLPRTDGADPEVVDFFLDPVGKPYYLLADSRLVTANPLGGNTFSFYDSSLGTPDLVDVSNPFNLLLYYREYGTVLVLDRTLSELRRIDLFARADIQQPGAIARSYDNGLWVFDDWDYRLLRLNADGQIDQRSNNLRLELGEPGEPAALFVDRNTVLLYFPATRRLATFTNYGKFTAWIDLPEAERVTWNAPRLLLSGPAGVWTWSVGETAPEPLAIEPRLRAEKLIPTATGLARLRPDGGGIELLPYPEK